MSDTGKTIALIKALAPAPEIDPELVKQDVEDWLDDHPEATTTVQDGSITRAKLASALAGEIDDTKSAINTVDGNVTTKAEKTIHYYDFLWEKGYIGSNGSVTSHTAYCYTDFIRTDAGDSIEYQGLRSPSSSYAIIAYYDKAKAYMSTESVKGDGTASQSGTATVPNGAAFVRFVSYYFYEEGATLDHITMPMYTVKADTNAEAMKKISDPVELMQYTADGFEQFSFSKTGKTIKWTDGTELTYQYMDCTDYIPTDGMVSITATIKALNKYSTAIACYDADKNYIKTASLYPAIDGASSATWQDVSGTVTIANTVIKYIRIAIANNDNHKDDTISVLRERTLKADYLETKNRLATAENEQNPWKGKNWFVFGTSMSDDDYPNSENDSKPTGVFPKYLQALSGMVQFNHGRAGGTISTGGPYSASGQIYSEITSTDFSTADLITLEGFINDFAECIPLGDLGDTTQETFCGALYMCIKYLSEHNKDATIVVITDTVGKEYTFQQGASAGVTVDYSSTHVNALGLHQVDYNNATLKICQWMGVHCIDVGGKSQINEYRPEYIVDQCHHTEKGGEQFARTVWEELRNILPSVKVTEEDEEAEEE